ncbi:MAG: NAD(P)H-hydrate dehydratase [Candidatus Thermoplasmatota archaeon]
MIKTKEVYVLDKNAEYYGVKTSDLMENAGSKVAEFTSNLIHDQSKKIIILCGTGNNGGDGFVAARHLKKKYDVSVFLAGSDIRTSISKANLSRLQHLRVPCYHSVDDIDRLLTENDIIIDALLGVGIQGETKEPYTTIIEKVNRVKDKTIISIDVPSGLGTKHAVKPDYTVTFHDVKEGMNKENSGVIHIADIGIPKDAVEYVGPGELAVYYPKPRRQSHKGENGSVLVIGGGPYTGAPALAGLAALRTGVDLVFIATPKRSWSLIASYSPDLIVKDLTSDILNLDDIPIIRDMISKTSSVIVGPGLGSADETYKAIIKIIGICVENNKPLVIDADAIKPTGENPDIIKNSGAVITPHAGEFQELTGEDITSYDTNKRKEVVKKWAKTLGVSILLKGFIDVISNGEDVKLNKIHNEAMTVGGTGDVLTGIVGALLSKGVEPYNAARIAAFINGESGNQAFKKKYYGLLATDIIEEIPEVLRRYL